MVFSSFVFLFLFLPLVLTAYYLCPRGGRNLVLFLFSLVFYAWGEPRYILVMLLSILFNYAAGRILQGFHKDGKKRQEKITVFAAVLFNLGVLGFFKYNNFFLENINSWFGTDIELLQIALPIGISFYTFQSLSYVVDVYRGQAGVQNNLISFGTYVTMFPQLVAGPIVRYQTISEQLEHRHESAEQFACGIRRFIIGLGKKVLLANNVGLIWDQISAMPAGDVSVGVAWLGAIAFGFQIYFDFSGYSDMAIGLGKMFGFTFLENFNYPYISKSITEFWRRWHISLGTWFREYLYIPLGGNRKGKSRQILNLLIVWGCTGFWHGASWNFLLWGLYFAVILIFEKLFLLKRLERCPSVISHIYALLLILCGWVIFAFDNLSQIGAWFGVMFHFGASQAAGESFWYLLQTHWVLFLVLAVGSTEWPGRIWRAAAKKLESKPWLVCLAEVLFLGTVFLVSTAFLAGDSYNPFLYFRF